MNVEASSRHLTVANVVTGLRVLLVPVVAVLLALDTTAGRWWALGVFVFAALTDSIDGYVARRGGGGVSRLGQLADPLADKLLIVGSLVVLAWQNDVAWWAVVVIAIREVAITVQRQLLMRRGVVMPADRLGKIKTITQMVWISVVLAPGTPQLLEDVLMVAAVVLTVWSGVAYARLGLVGPTTRDA